MLWFRASKWPKQLVVVIPGNPGLPGYYHEFAQALNAQNPETREVVVLGHAGHYDEDTPTLTLEEQVEHKRTQVTQLLEQYRPFKPQTFLIGHSIGAYIGLYIAQPGMKLLGLFPTLIHLRKSRNGQRLAWLFTPPVRAIISAMGWLFKALPEPLLSQALKPWNAAVTQQLATKPRAIYNCLAMAHDEMTKISDEALGWTKADTQLTFYYGQEDAWVEKHHPELIKSAYPHGNHINLIVDISDKT